MAMFTIEPNPRIMCKVCYEDADLLIVSKPTRVVTLPGKGHENDTLLNALFATHGKQLQNMGRAREFGLLHRLDRETSGLVMLALRASAYDAMREQFTRREVAKYYWAIVKDEPSPPQGVITKPILEFDGRAGSDPRIKKLGRVSSQGKPAITAYRTLATATAGSLVECRAVTGRLHQVRLHMESIGCPVFGDDLYGPSAVRQASPRLALHAHQLVFKHPASGERVDVGTTFPDDLRSVLKRLGLATPRKSRVEALGDEENV